MSEYILEMMGVTKSFPGIKALDEVDFRIRSGEVHALIGENGAGKSTLVKVLTGVHSADAGSILLRGEEVAFRSPHDSRDAGIAVIHQEATMFPELSITENIFMGHQLRRPRLGRLDWPAMHDHTEELLGRLELSISPKTRVKDLSVAQRHMVEIAKALSFDAQIVIMDEPTSALSLKEVEDLYRIVENLRASGKAVVFISHKFDEIFRIADSYTVLRDGKYVGEGSISDVDVDTLVKMMVGRSLDRFFPKVHVEIGEPILEVEGLTQDGVFRDISFTLRRGEILGFFGLVGAGRSEVMRALFGIDPFTSGSVRIRGKQVSINTPRDAMQAGLAYVPEDRQQQGAVTTMTIRENITLPILDKVSRLGFHQRAQEREVSDRYGSRLNVKAASWEQLTESLSGGNQQKVVLAKWLATDPEILLLDEPTKGIDVGTKAAVHEFMGELVSRGLAVVLISSELPEVMGMADRLIVMHEGRISASLDVASTTAEEIMKGAVGAELSEKSRA